MVKSAHFTIPVPTGENTVVVPQGEWDNFGQKAAFTCRFHAWTYNDRGELIGAQEGNRHAPLFPQIGEWPDADNCDTWEGFIFINLDENPSVGLHEYLGEMGNHFSGFPYSEINHNFTYYTTSTATGRWAWTLLPRLIT